MPPRSPEFSLEKTALNPLDAPSRRIAKRDTASPTSRSLAKSPAAVAAAASLLVPVAAPPSPPSDIRSFAQARARCCETYARVRSEKHTMAAKLAQVQAEAIALERRLDVLARLQTRLALDTQAISAIESKRIPTCPFSISLLAHDVDKAERTLATPQ